MTDIPPPPFAGTTAEQVLTRMLDGVDDAFIKTEGDIIHDMLAPPALEIERVYAELEGQMEQVFPATATGDYLTAHAEARGLERLTGESDDALRARLLAALRSPMGAGSVADYRRWLGDVPDLAPIQVVNEGSGALSVYVRYADMTTADSPLLAAVQAVLDAEAPATATATATAATQTSAPFYLTLTSYSAAQQAAWTEGVWRYWRSLAPGDDFNIYNLLIFAGIPVERYVEHAVDSNTAATIARSDGATFRITEVVFQTP